MANLTQTPNPKAIMPTGMCGSETKCTTNVPDRSSTG